MHAFITRAAAPVGDCHATAGRKKNSPTPLTEADLNIYLISLATRSWHGFKWGYSLLGEPMPRPRYHIDLQLQRKRHTMDVSPGSERYFKMRKVKFGGLPDPLHLFRLSYFRPGIYMATLTLHVSFNSAKDYSPNLRNGFRNSKMNLPFTSGLTRHLWILSSFFAFFFL